MSERHKTIDPSWYPLILDVLQEQHPEIYRQVLSEAVNRNALQLGRER